MDGANIWHTCAWWGATPFLGWVFQVGCVFHGDPMVGRCRNKGFRGKRGLTCPKIEQTTLHGANIWHTCAWWGAPTFLGWVFQVGCVFNGDPMVVRCRNKGFERQKGSNLPLNRANHLGWCQYLAHLCMVGCPTLFGLDFPSWLCVSW